MELQWICCNRFHWHIRMVAHGIGDLQTVSARALNAGVDMDMVSEGFIGTLKQSLVQGK